MRRAVDPSSCKKSHWFVVVKDCKVRGMGFKAVKISDICLRRQKIIRTFSGVRAQCVREVLLLGNYNERRKVASHNSRQSWSREDIEDPGYW